MPLAALAAVAFRCNLPIAIALAWVSNPLTTPFILVLSYNIGALILQSEPLSFDPKFTFEWIMNSIGLIWKPLLLGCVITGLVAGALGYFIMQAYWRWSVTKAWQKRKARRLATKTDRKA